MALRGSGCVGHSWGSGHNGRLGLGTQDSHASPQLINAFLFSKEQKVLQIAAGESHNLARTKDGK